MRISTSLALASAAFLAGLCGARLVPAAAAQGVAGPAPVPLVINLKDLADDAIAPAKPGVDVRSRTLLATPGATVSVQSGDVFKHYHRDSDEVQYVIEGTGTFWLGDTQRTVRPGDLIVIPRGTPHAGSIATSGRFRAIAIKTPPQAADDVHRVD
jgi:quercetin dioxygenase-like cupin family protein